VPGWISRPARSAVRPRTWGVVGPATIEQDPTGLDDDLSALKVDSVPVSPRTSERRSPHIVSRHAAAHSS
jgi:hypothetical protein